MSRRLAINEEITAPEVLLIGMDGARIGVLPTGEARKLAQADGYDLVEVQPGNDPPVCRIMRSGEVPARAEPEQPVEVRSIRFPVGLAEGNFRLKLRHVLAFLHEGGAVEIRTPVEASGAGKARKAEIRNAVMALHERISEALSQENHRVEIPKKEHGDIVTIVMPALGREER